MKKQILSFGLAMAVGTLFAQDIHSSKVPSVVLNQFNIDFPSAQNIDWELIDNVYNADFEQGFNKELEVWYTADGKQIRLEEDVVKSELPAAVISTLKNNYSSYQIDEMKKHTENNKVVYIVEIEKMDIEQTICISENGLLIK